MPYESIPPGFISAACSRPACGRQAGMTTKRQAHPGNLITLEALFRLSGIPGIPLSRTAQYPPVADTPESPSPSFRRRWE